MINWSIPYTYEQQIKLQEWSSETKNFVSSSQEDYFYHPLHNFVLICIVLVLIYWSPFTVGRMRQLLAPLPVSVLSRRNKGAFSIKRGFPGAGLIYCLCFVLRDSALNSCSLGLDVCNHCHCIALQVCGFYKCRGHNAAWPLEIRPEHCSLPRTETVVHFMNRF